jgi:hypothetical protein
LCTPQVPSHLIPEEVLFSVSHCLPPCFHCFFHFHSPTPSVCCVFIPSALSYPISLLLQRILVNLSQFVLKIWAD